MFSGMKCVRAFALLFALLAVSFTTAAAQTELIRNGDFNAGLDHWNVNPKIDPSWNPLQNGAVNLHPPGGMFEGFTGTVIYQNLNVTDVSNSTLQFSMDLHKIQPALSGGPTILVELAYVEGGAASGTGILKYLEIEMPLNEVISSDPSVPTRVDRQITIPADARKLVKIAILKETWGELVADNISLTSATASPGPIPSVNSVSSSEGPYGTQIEIAGSNFGSGDFLSIGGSSAGAHINFWSDTSITATVNDPARSGWVYVVSDFVESDLRHAFHVTSPNYTVDFKKDDLTVVKGQTAEYLIRVDFHNEFETAAGIDFSIDPATLPAGAGSVFTPLPLKNEGGILLKIDTADVDPGDYFVLLKAEEAGSQPRTVPFWLEVVTIEEIRFFKYVGEGQEEEVTSVALTRQGQFNTWEDRLFDIHATDSNGGVWPDVVMYPPGVSSPLTVSSSDTSVVQVYTDRFGVDYYAVGSGTAEIVVKASDDFEKRLPVTVTVAQGDPKINQISITPQEVHHNYAGNITFHAEGTSNLAVGFYLNELWMFQSTFFENLSAHGSARSSVFTLQDQEPELGTVFFSASVEEGSKQASSIAALRLVPDPGMAQVIGGVRQLDDEFGESFRLEFYDEFGQVAHERDLFMSHRVDFHLAGIPAGIYRLRLIYWNWNSGAELSQWYPNAGSFDEAQALEFTAGNAVEDIYFFLKAGPGISFTGRVVASDVEGMIDGTPVEGARVTVVDDPGLSAFTDENGNFTLTGLPSGAPFTLEISHNDYVTVYSSTIVSDQDVPGLWPFVMFTQAELDMWRLGSEPLWETGKGMITGRVVNAQNPGQTVGGVAVGYWSNHGNNYDVVYFNGDSFYSGPGATTSANGLYYIFGIEPDDKVVVDATAAGWAFQGPAFHTTYGDAVHEGLILGTLAGPGPGPTVSFSGWVRDNGNQAVTGARVEAWKLSSVEGVPSPVLITEAPAGGDAGAFTLTGLPTGPENMLYLHIPQPSGTDYAPILSRYMILGENIQALLPYRLFTGAEYTAFGNSPGTGMILGRVVRRDNPGQGLVGATVTVQRWTPGELRPDKFSAQVTSGENGIYMVKNVPLTDDLPQYVLYQVTASMDGYTFQVGDNNAVVPVAEGTVTQESFFATQASEAGLQPDMLYMRFAGGFKLELQLEGDMSNVSTVTVTGPAGSEIVGFPLNKSEGESWNVYPPGPHFIPEGDFPGNFAGTYTFTATYSNSTTEDFTFNFQPGTPMGLPSNVNVNEGAGTIAWDQVTGAQGYYLIIFSGDYGQTYNELYHGEDDPPIPGTGFNLFALMAGLEAAPGDYKVRVVAVDGPMGNEAYGNPVEFSYTPAAPSILGTWGAAMLTREQVPPVWYAEQSRVTFNADGSGMIAGIKNDGGNVPGDRIKTFDYPFTYTLSPNLDGSFALAMNIGEEQVVNRVVLSDDGTMAFMDGTSDPGQVNLAVLIRIDPEKTYDPFLVGQYYYQGFQYNEEDLQDPPDGFGRYMALSGIHEFFNTLDGGNYLTSDLGAWSNSVRLNGTNQIWHDSGETGQAYNVSPPTGEITMGGGFFRGAVAGNGRIFAGTASYESNDWGSYFFMKRQDRSYATADLAGKWAVAGFGQENPGDMFFIAGIGTMTCDASGVCQHKFKERAGDGRVGVESGEITFAVASDGSIGGWLVGGLPSAGNQPSTIIGAIGNGGNTLMLNASFESADRREVLIAIRAENIGDLAGLPDVDGVSFSGMVLYADQTPVPGATVSMTGNPGLAVQTDQDGLFTLAGLPAGAHFSLKVSMDGYVDVYTPIIRSQGNIDNVGIPFILFTPAQASGQGMTLTAGQGAIMGRVKDRGTGSEIAGAVVSVESSMGGTYHVGYPPDGAGSTDPGGRYRILNVLDGDRVTVTAGKEEWAFDGRVMEVHGNAIVQGHIFGTTDAAVLALRNSFDAAMAAFNARDLNGFMAYVSEDYLDDGQNKAGFSDELQEEFDDPGFTAQSYVVLGSFADGATGQLTVLWRGVEIDVIVFRNEDGAWKIYGNQAHFEIIARSGHQRRSSGGQDQYWVSLEVEDPGDVIHSVTVAGDGIDGSIELYHDEAEQRWNSWHRGENPMWDARPELPLTYTFTVNYSPAGTPVEETFTVTVSRFVEVFPADPSPAEGQTVAGDLVFSWTPVPGFMHGVEIHRQGTWERVWEKYDVPGSSVAYDGPPLESGSYLYNIVMFDGEDNYSILQTGFLYQAVGPMPGLDQAIRALKVVAGENVDVSGIRDVNNDGRIGLAEALYVLQANAGLRQPLPPVQSVSGSASLVSWGWGEEPTPFDGFQFSTQSVVDMDTGDFIVEWNIIFLGPGVTALDLGTVPLAQITEVPAAGYGDEENLPYELEGRTIAFRLADGTYAVIQFTEAGTDIGDNRVRSSFNYKWQPNGTRYF